MGRTRTRNEKVIDLEKLLQRPRNQRKINFGRDLAKIEFDHKKTDFLVIASEAGGINISASLGEVNIAGSSFNIPFKYNVMDAKDPFDWFVGVGDPSGKFTITKSPSIANDQTLGFGKHGGTGVKSFIKYASDSDSFIIDQSHSARFLIKGDPEFILSDTPVIFSGSSANSNSLIEIQQGNAAGEFLTCKSLGGAKAIELVQHSTDGGRIDLYSPVGAVQHKKIEIKADEHSIVLRDESANEKIEIKANADPYIAFYTPGAATEVLAPKIKYTQSTDDFLTISGSSKGIVLSGSTVQIAGTLEGASPLKIGGEVQFVSSGDTAAFNFGPNKEAKIYYDGALIISGSNASGIFVSGSGMSFDTNTVLAGTAADGGSYLALDSNNKIVKTTSISKIPDDTKLYFGTDNDAHIEYNENGDDFLIISGSAKGTVLSGSSIIIDSSLGVGVAASAITHAITLPNNANSTGEVLANSFITYSSERYKNNIQTIDNPMSVINNLNGVSFNWKDTGRQDYGFIAEDVGKVLPNIVSWEKNKKDAHGMDYLKIISFLVEATKEQQIQIDNLNREISLLKKENNSL